MSANKFPKELYVKGAARCLADSDGFVNANSGDMAFEVSHRWNSHEALVALAEYALSRDMVGGFIIPNDIAFNARAALKLAKP